MNEVKQVFNVCVIYSMDAEPKRYGGPTEVRCLNPSEGLPGTAVPQELSRPVSVEVLSPFTAETEFTLATTKR